MGEGEKTGAGTVDPYSFGVIVGKLDGIRGDIGEIKAALKEVPTRRELEDLEERVTTLENAPGKNSARRLSVLAVIISGITGVASIGTVIVAAFHR